MIWSSWAVSRSIAGCWAGAAGGPSGVLLTDSASLIAVGASGLAAHRMIPGSQLHRLPIEDQDVPLIPFPDWAQYEDEIADVLSAFIAKTVR